MKIKNEFIKWAKQYGQTIKASDIKVKGNDLTLWKEGGDKDFFEYKGNGEFEYQGSKEY